MNTQKLGAELAQQVTDAVMESSEEISEAFGIPDYEVFFEYIAVLFWTAGHEVEVTLPEEDVRNVNSYAFSSTWMILTKAGVENLHNSFNEEFFQEFMVHRLEIYENAWCALQKKYNVDNEEANEATIAHNFIILCITKNGDLGKGEQIYRNHPSYANYTRHIAVVLRHYRVFVGRVKAIMSRN